MPRLSSVEQQPAPTLLKRFNLAVSNGVRALADSYWTKFFVGAVLLISGLDEAYDSLSTDLSEARLGAHHGVLILGFVNVLAALPDVLDGLVGTLATEDAEDIDDEDAEVDAASPADVPAPRLHRAA